MTDNSDNRIASGTCGENLEWFLTGEEDNYTLTVSGTGDMENCEWIPENTSPWKRYNSSIKTVKINSGVISIRDFAFYDCSGLTSVIIPNSVTSIRDSAFVNCRSLTFLSIPVSVTSIGDCVFWGCSGLISVTIPNSVTSIGNGAFLDCHSLTSVSIPNLVPSIGKYAFYGCRSLTSITIPNSVKSIGDCAFWDCHSLTSVIIYSKIPVHISLSVFASINKNKCTLYVPKGTVSAYREATGWSFFTHIEEIPVTGKTAKI